MAGQLGMEGKPVIGKAGGAAVSWTTLKGTIEGRIERRSSGGGYAWQQQTESGWWWGIGSRV